MNNSDPKTGSGYFYIDASHSHSHDYLYPVVSQLLEGLDLSSGNRRIFEVGCGNGSTAKWLSGKNFDVIGIDPSQDGIKQANTIYPEIRLETGDTNSNLSSQYGQFPVVLSLEVVEHVYFPRDYARRVYELVEDDGVAILSTPYHGYWKNLALAISGKMDEHFTALWDYGHIKFWSERTLRILLLGAGFESVEFKRVGRIRPLAKSMIAVARK